MSAPSPELLTSMIKDAGARVLVFHIIADVLPNMTAREFLDIAQGKARVLECCAPGEPSDLGVAYYNPTA